ncbi:MAG TPA: ABC transporter permease [Thermoleophilaceae bacterium]|jgi:ABC-type nitrate/sulfonate/bicarbonate transport system permease component|nr:ABC transporter permease [Thermoleophilaceae bacterium]
MNAMQMVERERLARSEVFRRGILSRDRGIQVVFVLAVLGIWQYVGDKQGDFFLAPPTSVVSEAANEIPTSEFWSLLGSTASGIIMGFAIAAVLGVLIGVLMGTYRPAAVALNPLVSAGYVIPEAAIVPLLIVWFGLGTTPRVVAVVLFAIFEIIVTTYTGVRTADPTLRDVGRSFGASPWQLFRKVTIPGALPFIFAGLRIGAARAVKGMVVAELLFAATGIGGAISHSANAFRTDRVMFFVLVVTVIGVSFSGVVQLVERLWMRSWHESYAQRS